MAANTRRTATAIRFDPDLHDQLVVAAEARGVSINFFVNAAIRHALPLMVPPEQVRWFADDPSRINGEVATTPAVRGT